MEPRNLLMTRTGRTAITRVTIRTEKPSHDSDIEIEKFLPGARMHQSISDIDTTALPSVSVPVSEQDPSSPSEGVRANHAGWLEAFKQVLPIYLATHIAFLALTYLASLFSLPDFSNDSKVLHLRTMLDAWF